MNTTKSLFIGIDAADKDLIREWSDAGLLPTFQKLFNQCAWGPTSNPEGLYVGAVWPSIMTSVSPAQHGRYCWEQIKPGTYENLAFNSSMLKAVPFWEQLSAAGKQIAVIDIPKAPLASDINGLQIADWGTHDPDSGSGMRTMPTALAAEIEKKYGTDPVGNCNAIKRDAAGIAEFVDRLRQRIRTKIEITRDILAQGDWDCLLTTFSEAHCVGHQCWHNHDPEHPKYDPELLKTLGDPLKTIYVAIDQAIAELLETVDEDTAVIVLASHGMGPHYDATYLLDTILRKLETPKPVASYPRTTKLLEWGWAQMPKKLKSRLRPASNKAKTMVDPRTRSLSSRKYFQVPNNDIFGGVRINLRGREPGGKVSAGGEYDDLCQQLSRDLQDFINVETGEPVVKRVLRADELYHGPHRAHLPDLMVEWNRERPINSIISAKTGQIDGEYKGVRTGDHKNEGLVFVKSPAVPAGELKNSAKGMDIGPTIAEILGVELTQVEGKSLL